MSTSSGFYITCSGGNQSLFHIPPKLLSKRCSPATVHRGSCPKSIWRINTVVQKVGARKLPWDLVWVYQGSSKKQPIGDLQQGNNSCDCGGWRVPGSTRMNCACKEPKVYVPVHEIAGGLQGELMFYLKSKGKKKLMSYFVGTQAGGFLTQVMSAFFSV